MSSTKIASIVMYIVVGVSVVVMLIFYTGKSLVNRQVYEAKVAKIENPTGKSSIPSLAQDLQSADSLAAADSSAVANLQTTASAEQPEVVSLTFLEKLVYFQTDIPLMWGYVLLVIVLITTLAFPIIFMFKHPTNLIRSLLILVGFAVVIGIAYAVASGATFEIPGYTGDVNNNPKLLRIIDSGLIFMYFMLGIALLSILYSEVSNYFK